MKQAIIETGEVKKVEAVDRGDLLGYTEDEWIRRARTEQRPGERSSYWTGVMYIAMAFAFAVMGIAMFQTTDPSDLFFSIVWGGLGGIQLIVTGLMVRKNNNPVAVPGLYMNGVQLLTHVFVPYSEIGKVERDEVRVGLRKRREFVRLRSKFAKKPGTITDGWAVAVEFLGPGGMAALKERLEISRGLKVGTPELIIYGRDGAKTTTRGMGPADGRWG